MLCIDHLWLKVGVWRAGHEADARTNLFRWTVIYKANIAHGFINETSRLGLDHVELCSPGGRTGHLSLTPNLTCALLPPPLVMVDLPAAGHMMNVSSVFIPGFSLF